MKKKLRVGRLHQKGSFLIELLIAIVILVIVLVGYLQLFISCFGLSETSRRLTFAISQTQGKLEEIRNHNFSTIVVDYGLGGNPGNTFSLIPLNGEGVIYINNTNPHLLTVEIAASIQDKGNRVIGEDADYNGILDAGEDTNGNGKLDSPVSLISMIAER
jgi:type II secretory pathway pseudopilin PulG